MKNKLTQQLLGFLSTTRFKISRYIALFLLALTILNPWQVYLLHLPETITQASIAQAASPDEDSIRQLASQNAQEWLSFFHDVMVRCAPEYINTNPNLGWIHEKACWAWTERGNTSSTALSRLYNYYWQDIPYNAHALGQHGKNVFLPIEKDRLTEIYRALHLSEGIRDIGFTGNSPIDDVLLFIPIERVFSPVGRVILTPLKDSGVYIARVVGSAAYTVVRSIAGPIANKTGDIVLDPIAQAGVRWVARKVGPDAEVYRLIKREAPHYELGKLTVVKDAVVPYIKYVIEDDIVTSIDVNSQVLGHFTINALTTFLGSTLPKDEAEKIVRDAITSAEDIMKDSAFSLYSNKKAVLVDILKNTHITQKKYISYGDPTLFNVTAYYDYVDKAVYVNEQMVCYGINKTLFTHEYLHAISADTARTQAIQLLDLYLNKTYSAVGYLSIDEGYTEFLADTIQKSSSTAYHNDVDVVKAIANRLAVIGNRKLGQPINHPMGVAAAHKIMVDTYMHGYMGLDDYFGRGFTEDINKLMSENKYGAAIYEINSRTIR